MASTVYPDYYLYPGFSEDISQTSLSEVVNRGNALIINNLSEYAALKEKGGGSISASTRLLLKEGIYASITSPLLFREKCVGFLFVSTRDKKGYSIENANELAGITSVIGHSLYMEYIFQETIAESTRSIVSLMSERDNETSRHLDRMSRYSYILAREYSRRFTRLDPALEREILWFSPLHDIGKIGIPDEILHKNGPLAENERKKMQTHVIIGERIIRLMNERLGKILSRSLLNTAVEIIATHHERFDGTGYPNGLVGKEIPVSGRIVAVADVFDALTSVRPYKEAWTISKTVNYMKTGMSEHFDPEILSCLESSLDEIITIYDLYRDENFAKGAIEKNRFEAEVLNHTIKMPEKPEVLTHSLTKKPEDSLKRARSGLSITADLWGTVF